jgi:hypothetical protein
MDNPNTGYKLPKITLQIKLDNMDWINIFESVINFQEKILQWTLDKIEENNRIFLSEFELSTFNLSQIREFNDKIIQGISNGSFCDPNLIEKIHLSNDRIHLKLHLCHLHHFEGQVQISGFSYQVM